MPQRIKQLFDEKFKSWGITLPLEVLRERSKGSIRQSGWTINYLFGLDNGIEYIEYFASCRMTNPD
jgi:hypothetical protein